jgi:hypothetical protein
MTESNAAGEAIDEFFTTARTAGRAEAVTLEDAEYRDFVPEHSDPKLVGFRGQGYQEFADGRYADTPFLRELQAAWKALYDEPFRGITADGTLVEGLYPLPAGLALDPAPAAAAAALLSVLSPAQVAEVSHPLDAPEWRAWSNPEFVIHRVGLRLEDHGEEVVLAALEVVRASLSAEGFARVVEAMELNGFLGELVDLPLLMNSRSYWFSLFGDPTAEGAWGWQLFGHHVAVNFVSVAGRHVVAPVFIGAEPALTGGEREPIFAAREALALRLAGSLSAEQASSAVVFDSVLDPAMPEGRVHPADERHVAGAFRDNRVVPYEGLRATDLSTQQREWLWEIAEDFLLLLKPEQRSLTMAAVRAQVHDTWFSWYGATDGSQPNYLRIQSPVLIAELDHHAGVWLENKLPARFHVHSTLRLPNGNDYGKAYVAQFVAGAGR